MRPLPLASGRFGYGGREQWARRANLNSSGRDSLGSDQDSPAVARGFPGVDRVCALTLHRLHSGQATREQPPPPVHEVAVEWQGARYFAPCANLLAHHERLRPQGAAAAPAAEARAGAVEQWAF